MNFKRFFINKFNGYDLPSLKKPVPLEIKEKDKICILAPHADDETIGCGGLLSLYASQCDVILLTDGSRGGDPVVREKEFSSVMSFFDVHNYKQMKAKDRYLIEAYDLFKQLDFSPYDYVFMPHRLDAHRDHVVPQAFFRRLKTEKSIKARPVYYEVWGVMSEPTHFLDISNVAEKKIEAIKMYTSQNVIDYADRIMGLNRYRALKHDYLKYEEDYTMEG